jgi:uncharacterized protein
MESSLEIESGIPLVNSYDLSAWLYRAETLFEHRVDSDRWLIFAPDHSGLPVLLTNDLYALLHRFDDGACVGGILSAQPNFLASVHAVSALEEHGFLRGRPARLPYIVPPRSEERGDISVWLHITNACNLKCSYCFVGEKTNEGMDPDVMQLVARNIRTTTDRYGTGKVHIKFAGGEPTAFVPRMRRFREVLLREMEGSATRVQFGMLSNGTLVNDRLIDFLKEIDAGISISVDGFGEAHDIYRVYASGKGSWDIVSRNVQRLVEAGIHPYITPTISEASCHTLPDLVRWIYGLGLHARLQVVRNPGSSWAGGDRRAEYQAMNAKLAAAFDEAFTALEGPDTFIDLRYGLEICELNFEHPSAGVTCGIGDNHLVIKPDGTLASCPMTVMDKGVSCSGDLFEAAAKTFEHTPQERHFEREEDDCLHCQWFGVCAGGCPITNLRVKGHAFTRSPLCSFYKAVIPRYLRFYGTKMVQAERRAAQSIH